MIANDPNRIVRSFIIESIVPGLVAPANSFLAAKHDFLNDEYKKAPFVFETRNQCNNFIRLYTLAYIYTQIHTRATAQGRRRRQQQQQQLVLKQALFVYTTELLISALSAASSSSDYKL